MGRSAKWLNSRRWAFRNWEKTKGAFKTISHFRKSAPYQRRKLLRGRNCRNANWELESHFTMASSPPQERPDEDQLGQHSERRDHEAVAARRRVGIVLKVAHRRTLPRRFVLLEAQPRGRLAPPKFACIGPVDPQRYRIDG